MISFTSGSFSKYISYQLPVNKAANNSMLYHVVSCGYLHSAAVHTTPFCFTIPLHSLLTVRSQKNGCNIHDDEVLDAHSFIVCCCFM